MMVSCHEMMVLWHEMMISCHEMKIKTRLSVTTHKKTEGLEERVRGLLFEK